MFTNLATGGWVAGLDQVGIKLSAGLVEAELGHKTSNSILSSKTEEIWFIF